MKTFTETENKNIPKHLTPIKEKMDIYVPDVPEGLSRRNGMVYALVGSGGSGKTSLLLNMFKSKKMYRSKFHTIYYICPSSSFSSVEKHPFCDHDKVYHELTVEVLEMIYNQLIDNKLESEDPEYACLIIDDMANSLKDNNIQIQLNKMIIKARHLQCSFFFSLQGYIYFPKILRKQLTYITIFKPNNADEWEDITKELLHMNKEDGLALYKYIYDAPYVHLDIDLREDLLYKNFNQINII
jgi:hypothetical protein